MVDVLFVTNRVRLADSNGIPQFGPTLEPQAPGNLWCGVASVNGFDANPVDPTVGTLAGISSLNQGGFLPATLDALAASGNDVLVFIHGADNPFADAAIRSAYNRQWLAAEGKNVDLILFSWPSRDYPSGLNLGGDLSDYRADRAAADASAFHVGELLRLLSALKPRLGARKLHLLCHSMGNFALGSGVGAWFAGSNPATPLFDQIILAAADEPYETFRSANGARLARLRELGAAITVYFSLGDLLMLLSRTVNDIVPLGMNGAAGEKDTGLYPPAIYQFVDCKDVRDWLGPNTVSEIDQSHQYYRQSQAARTDIARTLLGLSNERYFYDPAGNVWWLVMPPIAGV